MTDALRKHIVEGTHMRESPILVLGMHKSGTTLIAETLHRSGISMVEAEQVGGYDDGNKMERDETRRLNIALLKSDRQESVRITRPLDANTVTQEWRAHGRAILKRQDSSGPWGFKDPRTLLTYEFWAELIHSPRLIGVFRDPAEVFLHYARRPWWRWIRRDPLYLVAAMHAWCVYNEALLSLARRQPNLLLLDYAAFMSDAVEMDRLARFVGVPLVDQRKSDMRRATSERTAAYSILERYERRRHGLDATKIHTELAMLREKRIEMERGYA